MNGDASSGVFAIRFFFLARGNVAVAPALAGPRGTTAARSGERGPNTPDKRWSGNRGGGIKLDSRAKERDSAGLAVRARSMFLPARYFLHEDAALRSQRVRAERVYATTFVRRGQHPLPHRDVGQDVIYQVRRSVAHPPSRARRARSAAFARERDNDFLTALRARDAQKAVRQDAATQIPAKLLFDVADPLSG
ncbi:MAG: hypothetical protein ABI134_33475 [Byssovorax sp.]